MTFEFIDPNGTRVVAKDERKTYGSHRLELVQPCLSSAAKYSFKDQFYLNIIYRIRSIKVQCNPQFCQP